MKRARSLAVLALVTSALMVPAIRAEAATGGLDPAFGTKGLTTVIGADDLIAGTGGTILVSGQNGGPAGDQGGRRVRLTASGKVDASYQDSGGPGAEFMTGGEGVLTAGGGSITTWTGCCGNSVLMGQWAVLEYRTASGRLASFGAFPHGDLYSPEPSPNGIAPFDQVAGGIVRLADGRYRICLSQGYQGDFPDDVILWGINADGTPDTAVGRNGLRRIPGLTTCGTGPTPRTASSPKSRGLFLDRSGRLYVVGATGPNGSGGGSAVVVRTDANGTVDTTYGQNGTFTLASSTRTHTPGDAEITQAGTLFLGLTTQDTGAQPLATIAKVTSSGVLDATFGSGGFKRFAVTGGSVTLDSLGTLQGNRLALAMTYVAGGQRSGRLTAVSATTGQPDRAFGASGSVKTGLLVQDTLVQGTNGLILSGKVLPATPGAALGQSVVERRLV